MTIKARDFTVPNNCFQSVYSVFDITPRYEYDENNQRTQTILGYNYEIVLEKLRFEKVRVFIENKPPLIDTQEPLEDPVKVKFDDLALYPSYFRNRINCKGTAKNVHLAPEGKE